MGFIEERFEINPGTTGITESDGKGATWHADIWDFKVPLNTEILLKPTDVFSCYLVGDDAVEMPKTTQIRVVRRDVANEDAEPVLTTLLYQSVKAFTDKDKLMHLSILGKVNVGPEEHIVVMINGADAATTGDVDASASHFRIQTTRRRKALS